jgi:hypothetical protein
MREGEALPIQRYPRLTEAAVAEVITALHQAAKEESWPESQTAKPLKEIQASADHLIEKARGAQLDAAITDWVVKVRSLAPRLVRHARIVLEEKSAKYTVKKFKFDN